MYENDHFQHRRFDRHEPDPADANRHLLLNAGISGAACVYLASFASPRPLAVAAMGALFLIAGWIYAALATLSREPLRPDRLTHWDAAAVFLLLSLAAFWLVSPETAHAIAAAGHSAAGSA